MSMQEQVIEGLETVLVPGVMRHPEGMRRVSVLDRLCCWSYFGHHHLDK